MTTPTLRLLLAMAVATGTIAGCSSYDFPGAGTKTSADASSRVATTSCKPQLAHQPWLHFLEVDHRGEYLPATFDVPEDGPCPRTLIRQIGAGPDDAPELGTFFDPRPDRRWTSCAGLGAGSARDAFLDCQLDIIVDALKAFAIQPNPGNQTRYLQIYIHGGLNDAKTRRVRADRDVPLIVLDCPAPESSPACVTRSEKQSAEAFFPLYIAWPSGGFDTYADSIRHYDQGQWDSFESAWPFRLIGDIGTVIARAPLNYVKSFRRWLDASNAPSLGIDGADFEDFGCGERPIAPDFGRMYHCEFTSLPAPTPFADIAYGLALPVRVVSVPLIDPLGKTAWDSMVARTRFAFRKPGPAWEGRDGRTPATREGVVVRLVNRLLREFPCAEASDASRTACFPFYVRLIGHSMGAIVASEIVRRFPELPYEAVVYMGAAVSIREFKGSVEPALKRPDRIRSCSTRNPVFFNLSLHPRSEMTETFRGGLATSGSLLEWIDTMYETPGDLMDRTLGRWHNLVSTEDAFDPVAFRCIYLKRFSRNWQSPTVHGAFDDIRTCTIEGPARKRMFLRPFYWEYEYWTAASTTGAVKLSERSADAFDTLAYWRPIKPDDGPKQSDVCVDDQSGVRLVPTAS